VIVYNPRMNRDNVVFTVCGLLIGLLAGGFFIGPWVVRRSSSPGQALERPAQPAMASSAGGGTASPENGAPMQAVMQQIQRLRDTLARDPNNFAALVQLGNLYMDAAKYGQAAGFYERALKVRNEPAVQIDLGICYRSSGSPEKALQIFQRLRAANPNDYYATFNEAIVLADLGRLPEARRLLPLLKKARPGDADVIQFEKALSGAGQ